MPLAQTLPPTRVRVGANKLCWRQWTAAGLAGVRRASTHIIDPEALTIASFSIARYDARLFDEALDWLVKNSELLDMVRVRRMLPKASADERALLRVASRIVADHGRSSGFTRLIEHIQEDRLSSGAHEEILFLSGDRPQQEWTERDPLFQEAGFIRAPVHLRELSGRPDPRSPACLRFRLRAMAGIGARSEVLTYLATHEWAHGRLIAERSTYGQAQVAAYLVSLFEAGIVERREEGRRVLYRLDRGLSACLNASSSHMPKALFADWINIWPMLTALLGALQPAEYSVEARWLRVARVLKEHRSALEAEGLDLGVGDLSGWGAEGPVRLRLIVKQVTAKVIELSA